MCQSNGIQNLVSVVSHSPFIECLGIRPQFFLAPGYAVAEALTEEEDALRVEEYMRLSYATEDRAVKIFLDKNMLAPLGTLHNVRLFKFSFNKRSKPQSRHAKMVQDLKDKVERNCHLSQAARNSCIHSFQLASTRKEVAV